MFMENLTVEQTSDQVTRVAVDIAGQNVWFELPTEHFRGSVADALTCLAFFPAMAQPPGSDPVTVEIPENLAVSMRLQEALPLQQGTFAAWGTSLTPFTLHAAETSTTNGDTRVVSSFSGGVDSLYTVLTRSDEITHLVHIQGYELTLDADPKAAGIPRLQATAKRLGKELIVVRTNVLSVYQNLKIQRLLVFGVIMATIAHLVGPRRYYIPSSAALSDLKNEGSHPLTDPRWSSEGVDIVYDGNNFDRIEKMRRVNEFGFLDHVIVCHYNFEENCCRCIKCVRTMLAAELLNLSNESFKEELTSGHIRRLAPLNGRIGHVLFGRYLKLARDAERQDLVRAMAYAEAKHRVRSLVKGLLSLIDDLILGGRVQHYRDARHKRLYKNSEWFHVTED